MQPLPTQPHQGETGPLAGSIIIVLVLLVGGWYVLAHRERGSTVTPAEINATPDPVLEATVVPQSTSTDGAALKSDFSRVPKGALHADFDKLDQELR